MPAVVITPYALGRMSNHFFRAARGYPVDEEKKPTFHLYLYAASIELALKAALLSTDCTAAKKAAVKALGHDLDRVLAECEREFALPLDEVDRRAISTLNQYYKTKALEYFTIDLMLATLRGGEGLPELAEVERAAEKVNIFLNDHKLFIEGQTSDPLSGGIFTFY